MDTTIWKLRNEAVQMRHQVSPVKAIKTILCNINIYQTVFNNVFCMVSVVVDIDNMCILIASSSNSPSREDANPSFVGSHHSVFPV